jgi:apolipoprotein N-acyltransferase
VNQKKNNTSQSLWLSLIWLGLAIVLLWLAMPRYGLAWAAWLGPVFMVRFVRTQRPSVGLALGGLALIGLGFWANQGFIPISGPGFYIASIIFSLPSLLPYLADRIIATRLRGFQSTLVLPVAWTALDYVWSMLPLGLGTIGSIAYSQAGLLPLLQIVSVAGVWAITFLIAWFAGLVNWAWGLGFEWRRVRVGLAVWGGVMLAVLAFGGARLVFFPPASGSVRVASIAVSQMDWLESIYKAETGKSIIIRDDVSQSDPAIAEVSPAYLHFLQAADSPQFAPVRASMLTLQDRLFELSEREAQAGAQVIVWSEANALTLKTDESALLERGQTFARRRGVYLFMGVGALIPGQQPRIENKVIAVDPKGAVVATQFKTKMPPGDPSSPGDGAIAIVATPFGKVAAVVCYDMDFPGYIQQAGAAHADLMLVPAADWKDITPRHAEVAEFRALENGFSLGRPVRNGLLVATDYQGRRLGSADSLGAAEAVLTVEAPARGAFTVYAAIGDAFAWLCLAGLAALMIDAFIENRWGVHRPTPKRSRPLAL